MEWLKEMMTMMMVGYCQALQIFMASASLLPEMSGWPMTQIWEYKWAWLAVTLTDKIASTFSTTSKTIFSRLPVKPSMVPAEK